MLKVFIVIVVLACSSFVAQSASTIVGDPFWQKCAATETCNVETNQGWTDMTITLNPTELKTFNLQPPKTGTGSPDPIIDTSKVTQRYDYSTRILSMTKLSGVSSTVDVYYRNYDPPALDGSDITADKSGKATCSTDVTCNPPLEAGLPLSTPPRCITNSEFGYTMAHVGFVNASPSQVNITVRFSFRRNVACVGAASTVVYSMGLVVAMAMIAAVMF